MNGQEGEIDLTGAPSILRSGTRDQKLTKSLGFAPTLTSVRVAELGSYAPYCRIGGIALSSWRSAT